MTPIETLEIFARYGGYVGLLMGVIIVLQSAANILFWRHIKDLQTQVALAQDRRVDDAKEVHGELLEQARDTRVVLAELMQAMRALRDAIALREGR